MDPTRPLRDVIQAWPSNSDASIRAHYDSLWKAYASASGDDWDPRAFSHVAEAVIAPLSEQPEALAAFFERLGLTVLERAQLASDVFRPAQVAAALAVSLLPYLQHEVVVRQARSLQVTIGATLLAAGKELIGDVEHERFALLPSANGGLSELFYLPLRVAKVLGWTGAASLMFPADDPLRGEAETIFGQVLRLLLQHYAGSLVTMSDAQAPCWAIALSRAISLGLNDEAEQLAGLLYTSLVACKGKIARSDIPADKVLNYLIARHRGEFTQVLDLVEQPDETTTVLLKTAVLLDLNDEFDQGLWELDNHICLAYIDSDFTRFGTDTLRGGDNLVWIVGRDIFRVSDLVANWPAITPRPNGSVLVAGVTLASLLYPDRIPWFLLDGPFVGRRTRP